MSIVLTVLTLVGVIIIPYLVGKFFDLLTVHKDGSIGGTWVFGFIMCLFISVFLIVIFKGISEINKYYESIL